MSLDDRHASLPATLTTILTPQVGTAVQISDLELITMGASKAIWSFRADVGAHSRRLILRADPVAGTDPANMAREAAIVRAARAQGVPAPEVMCDGDGTDGIGSPYLIMEFIDGETNPQRILRQPELAASAPQISHDLGRAIASIHAIPPDSCPALTHTDDVAHHEAYYRAGPLSAAMEIGWRWLKANRPPSHGPVVVHGDVRHGNVIIDRGKLRAVLDWELVHLGDPLEDLGWITTKAWRFGGAPPVGGFGAVVDLLDGYESVAGWRPTDRDLAWWTIYGSVRWGTMCRRQAARHRDGSEQSLELALIGRRFAENEFDVLLGLGLASPGSQAAIDAPPAVDPTFGYPGVDDLLAATIDDVSTSTAYRDRLRRSALNVVRRELRAGANLNRQLDALLRRAGYPTEQALAEAIRDGAPLTEPMIEAATHGVTARLAVWNPKYAAFPMPEHGSGINARDDLGGR